MKNEDFVYVCPNCNKTMDYVGEESHTVTHYHYFFEGDDWEQQDDEGNGEHSCFYCPECGNNLPKSLEKIIYNLIM